MNKEGVIEKLKLVKDPEIGIDVWTLGLIYDIGIKDGRINILMTLTTPFCPFADELVADVKKRVGELVDAESRVAVELTFEPSWEPSQELRAMLGI